MHARNCSHDGSPLTSACCRCCLPLLTHSSGMQGAKCCKQGCVLASLFGCHQPTLLPHDCLDDKCRHGVGSDVPHLYME